MVSQSLRRFNRNRNNELRQDWIQSSESNLSTDDEATNILEPSQTSQQINLPIDNDAVITQSSQEPQNNESPPIPQQLNDNHDEENIVCI